MYLFHNDYNETCCVEILDAIAALPGEQLDGYGTDCYTARAAEMIKQLCGSSDVSVHFLTGGTQTNLTVISAALRPHQAVLAAQSGHINVHETGAVEATGHKVVTIPSVDGKLTADAVEGILAAQSADDNAEHMVQIKMLYISNSTELGTTYDLCELEKLSAVCRKYGVYLFLDGARLGYALTAKGNSVTLADLARLCDVFYIGGTKCGTMFGEAVVVSNPVLATDFRYLIKQRGAMLAKGWLIGVQFDALLRDGLYFKMTKRANELADRIRDTLSDIGYRLYVPGKTNQVFPILPNDLLNRLSENFTFMIEKYVDDYSTAVRFCTSWATTSESVDALCDALRKLSLK